ncbi:type II toxin-antitoxin system Phd/YefM family antitoxin [Streptomyces sp. DSM 44915]|uniref:Antitoxin n=1 Tax=Streptomyces chisholmiae TaxID=3075540 RepID=A0ABU2JLU1_9ACTN|nr:type II toxin-antitoxin system Phd/YefM family antitoxin [Streptomyces sp. DSM 44915]MDT0265716.1 type II toxin-antitoxin system Phd/YefM family antitoxin [Streptomyces sp. DSM 44915]
MTEMAISAARSQLGDLVRRAAHGRETVALTDHGHVAALLVSPQTLEDYEDSIAVLQYELRQARGDAGGRKSLAEVRAMLDAGDGA